MKHSLSVAAELQGLQDLEYKIAIDRGLASVEAWRDPEPIETPEEYDLYMARRRVLSTAENSLWNANGSATRRGELTSAVRQYEQRISDYNALFELGDGPDRQVARYLLWNRHFMAIDLHVAWMEARDRGILRKQVMVNGDGYAFYVVGLRYKVGDNTFSRGKDGREYRQFASTIGKQAIAISKDVPFEGAQLEAFAAGVPDLDDSWFDTYVGDGKGAVRTPAIPQKEMQAALKVFQASRHRREPQFDAVAKVPAGEAPAAKQGSLLSPQTMDLFGSEPLAA